MQAGVTSNIASGSGRPHGCGNQQKQHHDREVQSAKEMVPHFVSSHQEQQKKQVETSKSLSLGEKRKVEMMKEKKKDFKTFMRKKQEERQVPIKRRKVVQKEEDVIGIPTLEMPQWGGNRPVLLNHSQRKQLLQQNQQKQKQREENHYYHRQNSMKQYNPAAHQSQPQSQPFSYSNALYQKKFSLLQ